MKLGIDPKVDYAFKFLFGNEQNTQPLIHLLHAVLNPTPEEQIAEVQILNPFSAKMAMDEKLSILDIKARDQSGRYFNVEMQMLAKPGLRQRIPYYWARLYVDQLESGQDYQLLKPTISVCFVDGVLFPAVPAYDLAFRLMDPTHGVVLTEDLAIHFFELPKFRLTAQELATPLDLWLYFLRHAEGLDPGSLPGSLQTMEIQQAMEVLTMLAQVDIQKELYEGRIKVRRDELMTERWVAEARADLERAQAELQRAQADAVRAQADAEQARAAEEQARAAEEQARAAAATAHSEGMARGALIGQIQLVEKLLRREPTPQADLEAMGLEALEALLAQLERELPA